MENIDSDLTKGLLYAIKAERDGHSFYMMASRSTADPKGKEIFEALALEELDHMNFLSSQYNALLKTGTPDKSIKLGIRTTLEELSPIFSQSIKSRIRDAHLEMSALSIGIQLELESMKHYKIQAVNAVDPEIKKFFFELAEWESGHYHALLAQQQELIGSYWSAGGFAPF